MNLMIIQAQDPDTPLSEIMHPLDMYGLELELADAGRAPCWDVMHTWESVGDVLEWLGKVTP